MVLAYTFTNKCYFNGALRYKGDQIVLEQSVGDSFPWLERGEIDSALIASQSLEPSKTEAVTTSQKPVVKAPNKKGATTVSNRRQKA